MKLSGNTPGLSILGGHQTGSALTYLRCTCRNPRFQLVVGLLTGFLKRESIGDILIQADVANHLAVFTMDWEDRQI
jgi:hypothetical protein